MLGDHEDESEIVHPQSEIEQFIRIAEEDDVLDRILRPSSIFACHHISCQHKSSYEEGRRTLQFGENFERRLVIGRTLPYVRREDRVGVVKDVSRRQL